MRCYWGVVLNYSWLLLIFMLSQNGSLHQNVTPFTFWNYRFWGFYGNCPWSLMLTWPPKVGGRCRTANAHRRNLVIVRLTFWTASRFRLLLLFSLHDTESVKIGKNGLFVCMLVHLEISFGSHKLFGPQIHGSPLAGLRQWRYFDQSHQSLFKFHHMFVI